MTNQDLIYLDHAATTPLHPEVVDAMMPFFTRQFGNPSSIHRYGREAKAALTGSRDVIASSLGCSSAELVFTSGGTESDNMAVLGAALAQRGVRRRIVTTAVEHHAVLHACQELEKCGFDVVYAPVDGEGRVDMAALESSIDGNTALVSVMFVNNEVGTIQPIEQIGNLARERGALFHVDAVQALGVLPIDVSRLPVDLMSFTAHKINGPKGIGLLYVNRRVKLYPRLFGGNQERRRRAGTENVAGAVGFAKAVELSCRDILRKRDELMRLRQRMLETFARLLPEGAFVVNGHPSEFAPQLLNVSFPGTTSETMLMNMDLEGIAAASGSACSSGSLEPSHVLQAMNLSPERTGSAVRFSFGLGNCLKNVTIASEKIATILKRISY